MVTPISVPSINDVRKFALGGATASSAPPPWVLVEPEVICAVVANTATEEPGLLPTIRPKVTTTLDLG
jgi:hypothetical protein